MFRPWVIIDKKAWRAPRCGAVMQSPTSAPPARARENRHVTPHCAWTRSMPFPSPNVPAPFGVIRCASSSPAKSSRASSVSANSRRDTGFFAPSSTGELRWSDGDGDGGGGKSRDGVDPDPTVSCEDGSDDWLVVSAGVVSPSVAGSLSPPRAPAKRTRPMAPGARLTTVGRAGDGLVARYSMSSAASASSVALSSGAGPGVVVRGGARDAKDGMPGTPPSSDRDWGEARLYMSAVSVAAAFMSSFSVTVLRARPWRTVRTVRPWPPLTKGVRRGLVLAGAFRREGVVGLPYGGRNSAGV